MKLAGRHSGETIMVLGNGPSLKGFDFGLLDGYTTFGTNYIRRMGFDPDYIVFLDREIILKDKSAFDGYKGQIFCSEYAYDAPEHMIRYNRYYNDGGKPFFADSFEKGLYYSHTSIMPAINLAWLMGASRLVLLGLDLHDQTHCYMSDDVGKDREFPNIEQVLLDFERLAIFAAANNLEILNGNPNSRVKVFPFVKLEKGEIHESIRHQLC